MMCVIHHIAIVVLAIVLGTTIGILATRSCDGRGRWE